MKIISDKRQLTDGYWWMIEDGRSPQIVSIQNTDQGLEEFCAMVSYIGSDWDRSLCDIPTDRKFLGPIKFPTDSIESIGGSITRNSLQDQLTMATELEKVVKVLRTTVVNIDGGMMIAPHHDGLSIWAEAKIQPKK